MYVLCLLLAAPPTEPTIAGAALPIDEQWAAILACPKITVPEGPSASGVVIGIKDGFAYLLTAAHAVPYDRLEVAFTDRERYPKPAWFAEKAEVIARWPDPDLALVRFPTGKREVPTLQLAPPGQRPKAFPVDVFSVGTAGGQQAGTVVATSVRAKEFVRRDQKGPAFFWRTQDPSALGRSGGPLLDKQGRIIGLASANRGDSGYFAHLDEIQAALKRDGYDWLVPPHR